VITLGILIVFAVGAIIYKASDLMIKKAEKKEKLALEQARIQSVQSIEKTKHVPAQDFEISLKKNERILETSFGGRAYLIRIGVSGITNRILILSTEGKRINEITVKHETVKHENADPKP